MRAIAPTLMSILLAMACVTGVRAQTPQPVAIKSHTPQDYADIYSQRYRQMPADIQGFLTLPSGNGKFPAVVIIPGSGGFQQWMQDAIAQPLLQSGIATLIVDGFTGRGVRETAANQGSVPMAASVMDAFAALQVLAQHPSIDITRVGITGFSRGGTVAMFTNHRPMIEAAIGPGMQYAAHLPFYPGCSTTLDKPKPTAAPIMFLMGEKDDYTPAAQCLPYVERLKGAGAAVTAKTYPGAHHGWISDARQVVYLSRVQNFSKCEALVDDAGVIRELRSGATSAEGWAAMVDKIWRACGKWGANYGPHEPAAQASVNDMVRFFAESLRGVAPR